MLVHLAAAFRDYLHVHSVILSTEGHVVCPPLLTKAPVMQTHHIMNASGISMRGNPWKRCAVLQSQRLSKLQPAPSGLHQQQRLRCSASASSPIMYTRQSILSTVASSSLRRQRQGSVHQQGQQQQRLLVLSQSSTSSFQDTACIVMSTIAQLFKRMALSVGLAFLFCVASGLAPRHAMASQE